MIRIRLHVPGFIDVGDDFRRDYEAGSWSDLVRTERLAGWANDPKFDHWSISDGTHLMAEMKPKGGHREFWVIAYILEGASELPLPVWQSPRHEPPEPRGTFDPQVAANMRNQAARSMAAMADGIGRAIYYVGPAPKVE